MLTARAKPLTTTSPSAVLARLERAVRCSQGFRLCFVRCDDPVLQDQMRTGLLQRLRGKRVLELKLSDPVPSLMSTLTGTRGATAVIVRGLEHSILGEDGSTFLHRWQAEAAEVRESIPNILLVWLPDEALRRIETLAPELWAQRSAVYEVFPLSIARVVEAPTPAIPRVNGTARLDKPLEPAPAQERPAETEAIARQPEDAADSVAPSHTEEPESGTVATEGPAVATDDPVGAASNEEQSLPTTAQGAAEEADLTEQATAEQTTAAEPATATEPVTETATATEPVTETATAVEHPPADPSSADESEAAEGAAEPASPRVLPPLHSLTLAQKQAEIDHRMLRLQGTVQAGPTGGQDMLRLQASLLYEIGTLYISTGEWNRAAASLEESAATFNVIEDRRSRGAALLQLGVTRHNQGKLDDASGLYELSLKIAQQVGDRTTEGLAFHQIGIIEQSRNNSARATELFEESLNVKRELGDRRGIATTLHQLGSVRQRGRDLPGAIRLYQESLELKRLLGDRSGQAATLHQLGTAEHQQGNLDDAMRCYEESLLIKKGIGDRAGTAVTLGQIGRIHQQRGHLREALQHYATSWLMFRSLQSHYAPLAQKLIQSIRSDAGEEQFESWLRNDLRSIAVQIRKALVEDQGE